MLSDIAAAWAMPVFTRRGGAGERRPLCNTDVCHIICLQQEAFQRNKASVTRQLPQEESCRSWGLLFARLPRTAYRSSLSSFRLVCAIEQDFSRKLADGLIAVSKLRSCIACLTRLIAISLLRLLRLLQNVALSRAKWRTVEKTGRK